MSQGQHDALLLNTLRDLRAAVDRVQDGQDQLRDKLDDTIEPLKQRVTALETDRIIFKEEVKRDARKWGAIGGVTAGVTAGITAVVGLVAKFSGIKTPN